MSGVPIQCFVCVIARDCVRVFRVFGGLLSRASGLVS
jgi:hypothetical protein